MAEDQEEVKKRMKRFIAADNALRRPESEPGFVLSFVKFILVMSLIGGAIYGIYIWHPWEVIAETKDGANVGGCEYGYETYRAVDVLGFRFNEEKSVICKSSVIVE